MNKVVKLKQSVNPMEIMAITPDMAREWLTYNVENRPVREATIARYAKAMRDGQWELNGESIKFSDKGVLLDGQHRLRAIVQSDATVDSYVVQGLPARVFDTLDTGASRGVGDLLALRGEAFHNVLGSTLRFIWIHETYGSMEWCVDRKAKAASNRDILEVFDRHPNVRKSVSYVVGTRGIRPYLSHPIAAFCHYQFSCVDEWMADDLFLKLAKGAGLEEGNPILTLRNRLVNVKSGTREGRQEAVAVTIKAWNLWRQHKSSHLLRWSKPEAFPVAA